MPSFHYDSIFEMKLKAKKDVVKNLGNACKRDIEKAKKNWRITTVTILNI